MEYNPLLPQVKENPYPYYADLQRDHPVYQIESMGGDTYAVSRYEDVAHVLMHPELFSSKGFGTTDIDGRDANMLIGTDPPDHTRLRNVVNRGFTPRMIGQLEPRIRQLTDEMIGRVAPTGEMDLIADLAMPLPITIISEILGVEPERRDDFKRWSTSAVTQVGGDDHPDTHEQLMAEFIGYFQDAVEQRRREPKADLISTLVRAEEEQQALSSDEVIAFTILLLIAGNETTTNLIGNAVLALTEHPDQLARVRSDPSLIPNLVEEALRYDAPVQFLFRATTQETELAGTTIPQGAIVLPMYGAANRDERKYPDSGRFDVTRDTQGHFGFGQGIHFCLGAPLARLGGKIALEAIVSRLPNLARKESTVDRIDSLFLRGPKRLPLTFTPAAVTEEPA